MWSSDWRCMPGKWPSGKHNLYISDNFYFREMNKVQTAINAQLEQVIERQKHLGKNENVD